ncbi:MULTISPECIES: hypothetical protein [unclassified Thiocapsa]|uniref:hypothetical protein n=1 Tax=unclassified Thiocapsa TaxID=2641286 RepID=UPI0035B2F60A
MPASVDDERRVPFEDLVVEAALPWVATIRDSGLSRIDSSRGHGLTNSAAVVHVNIESAMSGWTVM